MENSPGLPAPETVRYPYSVSLANEYDLMFNRTMEDWYEIEEFVAANDCYGHLLSNHNCVHFYDFTRPNVTHCCIQTDGMHKAAEWQERYQSRWFLTSAVMRETSIWPGGIFPHLSW